MTLSVVTPALNQLGYLRQCVANVARQPEVDEHLVSDGGSTDGTLAFLEAAAAADSRVRFRSSPDQGMYDALNLGFAETSGELLGYLNCDDLLLPWAARLVVDAFARHPEADVVYGDALEQRGERWAVVVHPPPELLGAHLRAGGHLGQPAVFFRRRLLDRLGGFDHTLRLLGDHDLWLRAHSTAARFHKIWECLAVLRMVEGQLMEDQRAADQERRRLLTREHGGLPTLGRRIAGRALSASLHRAGIAALVGAPALRRLAGRERRLPWGRTLCAGWLRPPGPAAALRALLGPSAGVRYLELTPAGRRDLGIELD